MYSTREGHATTANDNVLLAVAVAEMHVNGVATRKVEAVAEALGVSSMSKDQVSRICADLDVEAGEFRCRPLDDRRYCYLWLDATWVRCRVSGRSVSQAVVTANAPRDDGRKHFVGLDLVDTESREDWLRFLRSLRSAGSPGSSWSSRTPAPGSPRPSRRSSPAPRGSAA